VVATVEGFYARAWTMLMGAGGMAGVILLVIVPLVLQRLQSQSFRDHKEDFRERAADDTKKLLQRTREELRTTMESHTKKLLTTMESDTKKLLERTRGELSTSMESLMLGYALWGQANARGADDQHMRVLDFLKAAQAFKRAKKPGLIARALQWAQICLGRRAVNVAVFAQDANLESQIQSAILGLKLPDNETQGLLRSLNEARERPAPGSEDSRAEQPEGPGPETAE